MNTECEYFSFLSWSLSSSCLALFSHCCLLICLLLQPSLLICHSIFSFSHVGRNYPIISESRLSPPTPSVITPRPSHNSTCVRLPTPPLNTHTHTHCRRILSHTSHSAVHEKNGLSNNWTKHLEVLSGIHVIHWRT